MQHLTLLDATHPRLPDPLLEVAGQRVLELCLQRDTAAEADERELDAHGAPRVRVGVLQQAIQHLRSIARVFAAFVLKILIPATPVHSFALRPTQPLRIATAWEIRSLLSSKRLALVLDVDHSTAHRIRSGEIGNPWELAALWAESLEAEGHDTSRLLEILTDAAERGRATYLETHPWQRSA